MCVLGVKIDINHAGVHEFRASSVVGCLWCAFRAYTCSFRDERCHRRAKEISTSTSFIPQQFENPSNPTMHYKTTGPEILSDIDVDVFVAGVGTGGTISGVTTYLKEHRSIVSVAVEPKDSSVISGGEPGPHMIQGDWRWFIPKNFDRSIVDEIYTITNDEAMAMASYIATHEGVLCGISAGANVHAALDIARRPEHPRKNVVTILCDSGERYLSMNLFNGGKNELENQWGKRSC